MLKSSAAVRAWQPPSNWPEVSALEPTRNVQVTTKSGRSRLTLGHYVHSGVSKLCRTRSEDAFMVVYEFFDHPAHPIVVDGHERFAVLAPGASTKIYDLRCTYELELSYPLTSLLIHIPEAALQELFAGTGVPPPAELSTGHHESVHDAHIHGLAGTLRGLVAARPEEDALFRDHILFAVMYHVASCYGLRQTPWVRRGGLAPWQLRRAKELIVACGGIVELIDLASECRLSPGYFARAFKVSTGVTPHRWLNDYRIEKAKTLLAGSKAPLFEIARMCGYADQAHFTKVFSRVVGAPPGTWRRRLMP
jgi:AraC-like DNA-binding protein